MMKEMILILKYSISNFWMKMLLAPLLMVYIFRSLFVLREYVLMLVISIKKNHFLTEKLLIQGYQYDSIAYILKGFLHSVHTISVGF